jgi:hypothetical protein
MEGLVKNGLLHVRVMGDKWLVPSNEDGLVVPDGCVVLFVHFHEHGLASPPTGSFAGFFTTTGLSSST